MASKNVEAMTSPDSASAAPKYISLHKEHSLCLFENACLPLRTPRYAVCRACEDICPVKAIHIHETAIQLDDHCVRCGRCIAVCPMGALALPGFLLPESLQGSAATLSVDCWKVPQKYSPEGAVRVPCLGGMSPGYVVELMALAGSRNLELMDRGWCSGCNASSTANHPAQTSLTKVCSLLEQVGIEPSKTPRLSSRPLPAGIMPAEIPEPTAETAISRRSFFGAIASRVVLTINKIQPPALESEEAQGMGINVIPVASRERERLLHGMGEICKTANVSQPTEMFYRIEISDACNNNQLCASICPTGALSNFNQENQAGLLFDNKLCIGCNECHSICPSNALRVLPNGSAALPNQPIHLTSFINMTCPECGQAYVSKDNATLCPNCDKRHHLASSAFQLLFGSKR